MTWNARLAGLSIAALLILPLGACKKKETETPAPAKPAPTLQPQKATAPPVVRNTVGVAECDEWLRKVEACMARDPAIRARYEAGYKVVNEAWPKNFAAGGSTRAALAPGCKTSLDTLDAACK